ncbi:hypothetical protein Tco_1548815 [Tanacetum coccineum]
MDKGKTAELHLALQTKEDPEAKEDRKYVNCYRIVEKRTLQIQVSEQLRTLMLVNQIQGNQQNPQNNQRQNQGNPKGNNQASTSTQGGRRAPDRVYSLCVEAAVKDNNVVNELGRFEVIVGMDWMAKHRVEVVCYEKYIRVLYGNDISKLNKARRSGLRNEIEIRSQSRTQNANTSRLSSTSKTMIQIMKEEETKILERRIEDVSVVRDFPKVFPKELSGLPLTRQVEFHIELIPGAAPITRAPYRLAPAEMKELAEQLKELSDKADVRAEVGEAQLTGPEIIHETTEKIFKIKDRMQAAVIDKKS